MGRSAIAKKKMGKVYFWCVILMRSHYTSTTFVVLDRVDFSAQSTHNICGRDKGFILFYTSVLNVGPYRPLFSGYQGALYLCVTWLGNETCHLSPCHAEGLLYHLHMTSTLLYSMNVFLGAVLMFPTYGFVIVAFLCSKFEDENIVPKCDLQLIECRLASTMEWRGEK